MHKAFRIRRLVPEDAPALTALIRRCYGETYGPSFFYDTDVLADKILTRTLCSVVAEHDQQLVGHMAFTVHHPGAIVCETGNTIVDQSARGQGLLLKLGMALHSLVLDEGYVGYVHYPTTAHAIMQRASVAYGGKETGVMLAYISSVTDPELRDKQAPRLAATVVFQGLAPLPKREVFVPAQYQDLIRRLYKNLKLDRSIMTTPSSIDQAAMSTGCAIEAKYCSKRKLLNIFTKKAGVNMAEEVTTLIATYQPKLTHIDLPLDDENIGKVVEGLSEIGFFFCGLLPEFAHTDLIRLQAISALSSDDLALNLINEEAIKLGEFICQRAAEL